MATIPMGNFGQAVAARGPLVQVPQGNPIGQATERAGQVAAGLVEERGVTQYREQQQQQADIAALRNQQLEIEAKRQEALNRAQASLTLAKTANDLHDVHDDVARRVLDGTLDADTAPAEMAKARDKITTAALADYSPEQRVTMQAHLEQLSGTLDRNLAGVIQKRKQQDTAATIDQFGEQVSREAVRSGPAWASQKYAAMVDFAGEPAGLSEETRAKLKQSFNEKVHATFFESAALGALTRDDPAALRQLRLQLQSPDGDALDPAKRNVLTHQFFGWEQSLLAKRDRAANVAADEARRRYNEAADIYNKGTDIALGGGYFSPEFITEMTTAAQGTEMQQPVADLIASQRAVAGFASRPAAERAAMLERARSARATPGQGTDPLGEKLLQAMTQMDDKLRTQADENPWVAAQQAGVIQSAPTFNMGDPQSAIATLQQRMKQISAVERWTGKRVSPLQPTEVEQVQKMVRQMPVDQAASMLAGFGASLGDADRVAALGKQLHDKDGTLGLAMSYASAQTTEGRYTAELVLRGDQALRDKTVMVDGANETGWKGVIAKTIRGAYSNREAEDQVIDAAFKITSALYAQNGSPNIEQAVKLATGGIIERNGQKVPLPYGMDERAFDKRIAAFKPADLAAQAADGKVYAGRVPMPLADFVAKLPDATLVHAGQGLYNVRAGTSLVTNAQGKRITLRVAP